MIAGIVVSVLVAAMLVWVVLGLRRVPEGVVYSVRRADQPPRLLLPGLHFIAPWFGRVVHKISLAGHTLRVEQPLQTPTGVAGVVRGQVYWQVLEPERADTVIERADELIVRRALDAVGAIDDPVAEPCPARNARLKQALNQNLRASGVLVTRVDLNLAA